MGYYMSERESKFFIHKKHFEAAMHALRTISQLQDQMSGGCGDVRRWYSWVNMDYVKETDLVKMVRHWRWEFHLDENGNVNNISFNGEKLGDDFRLFSALAPFVKRGSYIDMNGENGAIWRWKFDGKTVREISATISFR